MPAAARMRRSRERRRRGALCVMLEIGWSDLDALGALGLLDTDEADPVKQAMELLVSEKKFLA